MPFGSSLWPRSSNCPEKTLISRGARLHKSETKPPNPRTKSSEPGRTFALGAQGFKTRSEAVKLGSLRSGVALVSMGCANVLSGGDLPSCPWGALTLSCLQERSTVE